MSRPTSSKQAEEILFPWHQAVKHYLAQPGLSKADAKSLEQSKSTDDVVCKAITSYNADQTVEGRGKSSQMLFLSAVLAAETHEEALQGVPLVPLEERSSGISNYIGTFLRYANAIDRFLEGLGNTTFASAFIFGAIRCLVSVMETNWTLRLSIEDKFKDISLRLGRLDSYLSMREPSMLIRCMCVRVLSNILQFCALANQYFKKGIFSRPERLKNQMNKVIKDLDADVHIEIATGVAQLNSSVGDVLEKLDSLSSHVGSFSMTGSSNFSSIPSQYRPRTCFMVPYQKNPHFAGRNELLTELRKNLCDTTPKRYNHRMALYGLGGVGKTQVALEYIYRYRDIYQSVYWVGAANKGALLSGFEDIANATGCVVRPREYKSTDLAERVLRWLEQQDRWLLVLDNLDDVSVVEGFLPKDTRGHTLITTRNSVAMSIPAEGMEVDVLKPEEAIELLCTRSQSGAAAEFQSERTTAAEIVAELGCLPLAIDQAAAYIREASKSLSTFLPTYRANKRDIHRRTPHGNRDYSLSVANCWRMSFDIIAEKNPGAAKLLRLLAFLNPDLILIDFILAGVASLDTELQEIVRQPGIMQETLFVLEQYSLIKRRNDGQSLVIHRLVQAVIVDEMDEDTLNAQWTTLVDLCHAAFPSNTDIESISCRRFLDQVMTPLLKIPSMKLVKLHEILSRVGQFLNVLEGKYSQAEELHRKDADVLSLMGAQSSDAEMLECMTNLAITYLHQGKLSEAAELQETTLQTAKEFLNTDHPIILQCIQSLGTIYGSQGRLSDSTTCYEKVVEARSRLFEEDSLETLVTKTKLGETYRHQGKWDDAANLLEPTLLAISTIYGGDHPEALRTMRNLASTYWNQGRVKEMVKLDERNLTLSSQTFGEDHPDTLAIMSNLGLTYWELGRIKEGAGLLEKSLEATKKILPEGHPSTLMKMNNLGLVYWAQGRLAESATLQEKGLAGQREVLPDEHFNILWGTTNLAVTYRDQGLLEKAAKLEEENLKVKRRALGEEHPDTLRSITQLAITYRKQRRIDEATELEEANLQTCTRVLGERHRETLRSKSNLAMTYKDQGRLDEAARLQENAIEIVKTTLGDEHYETMTWVTNLSLVYQVQGRLEDGLRLEDINHQQKIKILGEMHPESLRSMAVLTMLYHETRKLRHATTLGTKTLEARTKVLGDDHPDTLRSATRLALIYRDRRSRRKARAMEEINLIKKRRILGEGHPETVETENNLILLRRRGKCKFLVCWS